MAFFSYKDGDGDNAYSTDEAKDVDDTCRALFMTTDLVLTVFAFIANGAVTAFMFFNRARSALGMNFSPFPPPKPNENDPHPPPNGNGPHLPPNGSDDPKGDNKNVDFMMDSTVVLDMFTCVFTSLLIFMLGLNRFGIFVWNPIERRVFGKTGLRIVTLVIFIISAAVSIQLRFGGMMKRKFDDNKGTMMNVANENADRIVTVFYIIPIISFAFYPAALFVLRRKHSLVTSEKTSLLLSKTERITLKIGIEILLVYSLALALHESFTWAPKNLENYFMEAEKLVATVPQLAVPIIYAACNSQIRNFLLKMLCCKSIGNGQVDSSDTGKTKFTPHKKESRRTSNERKGSIKVQTILPARNPHSILSEHQSKA